MTPERNTAVGVFENREQAHRAMEALRSAGFGDDQIGFAIRHDAAAAGDANDVDLALEAQKEAAEGAVHGALAGAGIGGLLGAAAALLIPGVGPVLAGGILATAIGAATVGAAAGGIMGALVEMGLPDEEAEYYEREFQAGRAVVTINAPGRTDEALRIMREHGAVDTGYNTSEMPNSTSESEYRGGVDAA